MNIHSTTKRAALAVAGVAAAIAGFPVAAQAQSYGSAYDSNGQYYYDGCRRDQNGRAVVGGVLGALTGMALGNNSSDRRGRRHDGAAIGTVVGAIAGASIGKSTAACTPQPSYSNYNSYNNGYAYTPSYNTGPSYAYQEDYYDRYAAAPVQAYAPPAYDYGRPPLACTYAESPVRMPDGRTQSRMVQVCPDAQGRYQIVQ